MKMLEAYFLFVGDLADWQILENGGNQFRVENDHAGSQPLSTIDVPGKVTKSVPILVPQRARDIRSFEHAGTSHHRPCINQLSYD